MTQFTLINYKEVLSMINNGKALLQGNNLSQINNQGEYTTKGGKIYKRRYSSSKIVFDVIAIIL